MLRFLPVVVLTLVFGFACAQTNVQLILDASGSMYNRLEDGRYRIVAAKEVLTDLVANLADAEGLNVGLRVYGAERDARDDGACEDSRLFVPMAGVDRPALLGAVRDVLARGATPIAYSLERAGEDVPAGGRNVIVLVTDGEESCGGDVRGVLESLAARGVEIDLRIVGFDLTERAARSFEGLGTFENARSGGELAAALSRALEDVAERSEATHSVDVVVTRGGVPAADGATVRFVHAPSGREYPLTRSADGAFTGTLPAGAFVALVVDAFEASPRSFDGLAVGPDDENRFTFELADERSVTLEVTPLSPTAGGTVTIAFEGAPEGAGHWIAVAPVDAPDSLYTAWTNASGPNGSVQLRVPGEPLTLEARYHAALPEGGSRVIGRSAPFGTTLVPARVEAPAEVTVGSPFDVRWEGPNNADDYVTIVPVAAAEGTYASYAYTRNGNPARIVAPSEPGEYEVRYSSDQSKRTFASAPVRVLAARTRVHAPLEVVVGARIAVEWEGPNNPTDYVTIVPVGAPEGAYTSYAYTRNGNPALITAPSEPGMYEVRLSSDHARTTFASTPVTVVAADVRIDGPAEVTAGSRFEVAWEGPDNRTDYLTIVPAGAPDGTYLSYAYTRNGNPVVLTAPNEPGAYELRYSSDDSAGRTFARVPIIVR